MEFKGAAKRVQDTDLGRIAAKIGVGEDILHAIMDVEAPKSGFDSQGRPRILFEPHIFYRELGDTPARKQAVARGLAYQSWKPGAYGLENTQYSKLERAMQIDETAALKSCSWGRGQIMGFNHKAVGYLTVQDMVREFAASEAAQIEAIVDFIATNKLDASLRSIHVTGKPSSPDQWRTFAKSYNGAGYEKNGYHVKLSDRHNWWRNVPDTPWQFDAPAELPKAMPWPPSTASTTPPGASGGVVVETPSQPVQEPGFLARFFAAFLSRMKG